MNSEKTHSLANYIIKGIVATFLVFAISSLIHYNNIAWCLISAILVIAPEGKDTVTIAIMRIKANAIGASMGLLCLLIGAASMWTMGLAVAFTLTLCYLVRLEDATRSALAASVIIMLHQEGSHLWDAATERVVAVLAGCTLGLLVTFVFHAITGVVKQKRQPAEPSSTKDGES